MDSEALLERMKVKRGRKRQCTCEKMVMVMVFLKFLANVIESQRARAIV
jgi:hypothetical protein